MDDDGAGGGQQERAEGIKVDEGRQTTSDQQSTIDGSGKGGRGYSCENEGCGGGEWSVPDHGGGGKVGNDSRAAVYNKEQWQQKSGNIQLKATVASSGVNSHEGSGEQRRSTAISCKMPTAKAIVVAPLTPLLSLKAGGGGRAAAAARV